MLGMMADPWFLSSHSNVERCEDLCLATLRNQQVHINEVSNKVKQTLQGKLKKKKMLVGSPKTCDILLPV